MKALLVGDGTGALAAARELGGTGWFVGVASEYRWGWASLSRRTGRWHRVPEPSGDLSEFARALNAAIAEQGYELILPTSDTALIAVSAIRNDLKATLAYAPHARVMQAIDKIELAKLARACGVPTPRTWLAGDEPETGYPVVVKPRLHWTPGRQAGLRRNEAVVARSEAEAAEHIAAIHRTGGAPVLQDFIPGKLVTCVVFADENHRIVAEHLRVTLQERMSDTGPIALAESQPVPRELRVAAERIAEKLEWVGLMSLQFLETREGRFSLIDLNGRIDGEHALTSACGLTGADAWARLATGRGYRLPEVSDTGQRYQAIEAEFLRRLAKPGPKRFSAAWEFVQDCFRAVHPIFQISDPLPTLAYFSRRMSSLLEKAGIRNDKSGVQPGDPSSGGDAVSPISRQSPPLPRVGAR
jgi:predicted ATP-grasp superfamily ATP-dependent carboligase